jgi:hypothetical protein
MNRFQELWWRQAQSDHAIFLLLRRNRAEPCHQLHYLQMVTEKLGKAFFWRAGKAPPKSHAGLVQFMRYLGQARRHERQKIADCLSFGRFKDLQRWLPSVLPLAYELERLAPDLAQDGPNPEYPWPQDAPAHFPADFEFNVLKELTETGRGRQLLQVIELAITRFSAIA